MVVAASPRYEVICRLAGGGMADLYLARAVGPAGFERLVVVKRLTAQLAADPSAMQALFDEARIAATLSHANIVQVTDVEVGGGQVSIVMEFLHGHDVSHLIRRLARSGQAVPLDQAVAITLGVCAGLHHAHERVDAEGRPLEIVHRDVSPHNVFVTYDGAVKLIDFGIARAAMRKGKTEQGLIKGKPGYIAPEQLRGRPTDRRTDVWGTAVLLFEMTTGTTPFGETASLDELVAVATTDPPAPSSRIAGYSPELEAIVLRGLARDPEARYPTAEAMRKALDGFARSRKLDLSPFRLASLMERAFAENLGAWREAQRHGRSLAEHVAAFRASGAHHAIALPSDPTDPHLRAAPSSSPADDLDFGEQVPIVGPPKPPRTWRRAVAIALGAPLVVIAGLVAWSALESTKRAATAAPSTVAVPIVTPIPTPVPTRDAMTTVTADPTRTMTPDPTPTITSDSKPVPDPKRRPPQRPHPHPRVPIEPTPIPTTTTPVIVSPPDPDAPLPR